MLFRGTSRNPAIGGEWLISGAFQANPIGARLGIETQPRYKAAGNLWVVTRIKISQLLMSS